MRPGKDHEGWWEGRHKVMQMELLADVFNCVFNTSLDSSLPIWVSQLEQALAHTRAANGGQLPYVACVQLNRSQNHLMAQEDGLNAKRMKKGRGYKEKNPHIRPTTWPMRLNTRFSRVQLPRRWVVRAVQEGCSSMDGRAW